MKKRISYIVIILIMALAIFNINNHRVDATSTGFEYVKQLGSGINLGNIFETGLEDMLVDDNSIEVILDNVRSQGFSSIRLPVTWQGHWNEDSKEIDIEYLVKLKSLVSIAISKNVNVILTMYDDSWRWISNTKDTKGTLNLYESLWKQIANYFKEYNEKLCFEAVNAPFFENIALKDQLKLLDQYNKCFVKAVRSTGGRNKERYLLLPVLNGQVNEDNCKSMASTLKDLKDSRIIVSVQYYGLWNFSVNAAGTISFNQDARQHMLNFFQCIESYFTKNKFPVVCVEYGLYGYPAYENAINRGERLKYFYQFLSHLNKTKLSCFLWDTGVLFNRTANKWVDEDLAYIVHHYKNNDFSYGSSDTICLVEGQANRDITISLTLNQGKLLNPMFNKTELKLNADYTVTKNKLTIKKAFLDSLKPSKNGIFGTLEIVFTKGPSWKINLTKVGQPSLSKDGSKQETWNIPMKEQGDFVVALEAFTKDKKPVGPLDWTTYQEYGYSFLPDYSNHSLNLTKDFIASLPEKKEIILRLHFQSGQKLDYTIIKDNEEIREITYDLSSKPVSTTDSTTISDLQELVEEENQAVINKEHIQTQKVEPEEDFTSRWDNVGWRLLFISFSIMVVLGFAILYIYRTHRKDNIEDLLEETEDQVELKIHKILVDKTAKDA